MRDLVRSRGLGDVYKEQHIGSRYQIVFFLFCCDSGLLGSLGRTWGAFLALIGRPWAAFGTSWALLARFWVTSVTFLSWRDEGGGGEISTVRQQEGTSNKHLSTWPLYTCGPRDERGQCSLGCRLSTYTHTLHIIRAAHCLSLTT